MTYKNVMGMLVNEPEPEPAEGHIKVRVPCAYTMN